MPPEEIALQEISIISMLLALQFSPVYVLSTNANDLLICRTNKNAGIIEITGLASVAFAGLCITYQD